MSDLLDFDMPIGRPLDTVKPGTSTVVSGGSAGGLRFDINWDSGKAAASHGVLSIAVADVPVFGHADGARIDLTRLLDFLSSHWDPLVLEHGYPWGITPTQPALLRQMFMAMRRDHRWASPSRVTELHRFEEDHNLLYWLGDENASPLWAVREGNLMVLQAGETKAVRWSFHDVVRTLAELGDAISARLAWARTRVDLQMKWSARERVNGIDALSMSLRLPRSETKMLVDKQILARPATRAELLRDLDEVRAAARMLGPYVDVDDLEAAAKVIGSMNRNSTPGLDELSDEAEAVVVSCAASEPYGEGQALAIWLRAKLGISDFGQVVDPAAVLENWGVQVVHTRLSPRIEAMSMWGPLHGPGVLINVDGHRYGTIGASPSNLNGGARATLAHEMCHLLVDRGSTLPVMEVLGGATPWVLEQRANAFGAEFLLPRQDAIQVYRASPDGMAALFNLTNTYKVTRTLAALQLRNYSEDNPGAVSEEDMEYYARIAGL